MESEITFLVTYRCSRCRASLSPPAEEWSGWLRCPRCGRAGLPPDYATLPPFARVSFDAKEDVLVIADDGSATLSSVKSLPVRRKSALRGGLRRLFLVTVLFFALLMLVFSGLEQNGVSAAVGGFIALACIGFLLIPPRH